MYRCSIEWCKFTVVKYVKSLDGVRAVAIILVMLFHYRSTLELGWIGVQLFFVLSGFLITSILVDEKKYSIGFYLKRFYWRRSLRIFPLYYLYIALVGLLYLVSHIPENYLQHLPFLLSYTFNFIPLLQPLEFDVAFTHFWSLAVEEQFYLIWPLVIYMFNSKQLKVVVIIVIILCPVLRYVTYLWLTEHAYDHVGEILYRMTTSQFDGFAFGAAIPLFNLDKRIKSSSIVFIISICLFLSLGFYNMISQELNWTSLGYPIGGTENFQYLWSYTLVNFMCLSLILFLLDKNNSILAKAFSNKFLVSIGKVSYGMYVYHWIVIRIYQNTLGQFLTSAIASIMLYFMIVYFISVISYELFELHFIKLKNSKFKVAAIEK